MNKVTDLERSVRSLINKLVSLFTYDDDDDVFVVGKVLSVDYNSVELHLVDKYFIWAGIKVIKFSDISSIGFDTQY